MLVDIDNYIDEQIEMTDTVSVKRSNRQARETREGQFEALAAFANLGDTPEAWRKFRLMWPDFFPSTPSQSPKARFRTLTEWIYGFAEEWATDIANLPPERRPLPPLLWYRNRLRSVWTRNDPHGYGLAILFGFEQEAKAILSDHPEEVPFEMVCRPLFIPGQPLIPSKQESEGLPQGRPLINGVTGEIHWKFGCDLQQAVYELMQCRWRAKVCPVCGRYFIAAKTATQYCSTRCTTSAKNERALDWWNLKGDSKRKARSTTGYKTKAGRRR
jgi:hypothetical protein